MPPIVTNGWLTTLTAGSDLPHAIVYAGNAIWVGCESTPGRICKIDPLNPSLVTTIILPNDGAHKWVVDMVYIPAKARIYALCVDPFDLSAVTSVVELDPLTGLYADVISAGGYATGQGSLAFDATYLYILSFFENSIHRYALSGWAYGGRIATSLPSAHALEYDSVTGNLFATSATNLPGSLIIPYPMVAQVDASSFTVTHLGFWSLDKVFSDDIAIANGYLWVGSETTGNIVKFLATDVSATPIRVLTGIEAVTGGPRRNFGVYFDGGVIWTGWEGDPGIIGRVNIDTNAVELLQLPGPGQGSPNEWVRNGPHLYITNYQGPGKVSELAVTNYDPIFVPPTGVISGTPTLGGTYGFTVHVVDADGNTGDVVCSIIIGGLVIDCNDPPDGEMGVAYDHTLTVTGGDEGSTVAITGGALPPGLSMDDLGEITGIPTLHGNYAFVATVTTSLGDTASVACTISINFGALAVECGEPPVATVGVGGFVHRPPVTMGTIGLPPVYDLNGTLVWEADWSQLPPGLHWDNDPSSSTYGHIVGTPTLAGSFSYTFTVSTPDGQSVTLTCEIDVDAGPPGSGPSSTVQCSITIAAGPPGPNDDNCADEDAGGPG